MANLKVMKVLDVQWGTPKMPDDIRKFFFNQYDYLSNDCWVEYIIGQSSEEAYEYDENDKIIFTGEEFSILDKWLLDNCNVELDEEILLKHWW